MNDISTTGWATSGWAARRARRRAAIGELEYEEEFNLSSYPADVRAALGARRETDAVKLAIRSGIRDENTLSDLVFFARHPERSGRYITSGEPNYSALSREWLDIRDRIVRPALSAPSGPPTPVVTPLAPLTAEEQAALRQLPPLDQGNFQALRGVIVTYSGVARTEADRGSRALLRRGLFRAQSQLLTELVALAGVTRMPSGWSLASAKPLLVGNTLYNLAFPETINQGGTDRLGGKPDPTCFSASTQMLLGRRYPSTYVRLARQLATTSLATFAGGVSVGPLTFRSTNLYRSLESVLLQTAFDTYFNQVITAAGGYRAGQELIVHRQVFGATRPPKSSTGFRSSDIVAKFRTAFVTGGGSTRAPELINLCTGVPSVKCGNHSVVITRVTGGRAFFYNPWANEEERNVMFGRGKVATSGNGERPAESSMTQANFESQLSTVFYN
ncbi:MAG TPA: hypothetical protein VIA61_07725 [Methylomirabilota bacterium]